MFSLGAFNTTACSALYNEVRQLGNRYESQQLKEKEKEKYRRKKKKTFMAFVLFVNLL